MVLVKIKIDSEQTFRNFRNLSISNTTKISLSKRSLSMKLYKTTDEYLFSRGLHCDAQFLILPLPSFPACTRAQDQPEVRNGVSLWSFLSMHSALLIYVASKSPTICQSFSKPPVDISLTGLPFVFLFRLLFAATGIVIICDVKQWLLIVFSKCPRERQVL